MLSSGLKPQKDKNNCMRNCRGENWARFEIDFRKVNFFILWVKFDQ